MRSVCLFVCHILSTLSCAECLSVCLSSVTLAFLSLVSVCLSLTFYPYLPLFHQDGVWYMFCDLIGCVCLSVGCVLSSLSWVMCLPSCAPECREVRRWKHPQMHQPQTVTKARRSTLWKVGSCLVVMMIIVMVMLVIRAEVGAWIESSD